MGVNVISGATKTSCVADAVGDISGMGVATVAVAVGVIVGVAVAGGAMAVWVWKIAAANVPTPAVRISFTSIVGSDGFCPAQEAIKRPISNKRIKDFRALRIFTSEFFA
jgi:hypothetical protein